MKNLGRIKFIHHRGYGFIIDSLSGQDVFFHASGLTDDDIQKDDAVTFELENNNGRQRAINIRKAQV